MSLNKDTCNGFTLQQWIEKETSLVKKSFWGVAVEFTPVLCEYVDGDGKQLIWVMSIYNRPKYWLLLIDSKTDISGDDFDLDSIISTIEEEFGKLLSDSEFENDKENGHESVEGYKNADEWNDRNFKYPMINWDGGFWGLVVNMVTQEYQD